MNIKKSIVMLATAAMGAVAMADAQVYEMQLTLKTTVTKFGKVKFVSCDCLGENDDAVLYRKQGTVKIKGLIWGCDCGTISEPDISGEGDSLAKSSFGYIFWNETTKKPLNLNFEWVLLNRIDNTAKKSEGVWVLSDEDGLFSVTGAGFGMVKDTTAKKPICERTATWIQSMNGNLAGWSTPGAIVTVKATKGECSWCEKVDGTDEETASALGWSLCECSDSDERTAASGTWRLKFNARSAKILSDSSKSVQSITEAYNFPSYVKSVIE